jgi:hypothetical protein
MKKSFSLLALLMFGISICAQSSSKEPTLQETLDWLSSKCTTGLADYNDKPNVFDRQVWYTFKYNLERKEIQYYANEWLYLRDKADKVLFTDTYLQIHFADLSGCQITTKKEGMRFVEIKLASHNKCKEKVICYDNTKHQKNPNYNYEDFQFDFNRLNYEPDKDCLGVVIKLFYREDLVSGSRIIKAIEHLIKLTGGSPEPF